MSDSSDPRTPDSEPGSPGSPPPSDQPPAGLPPYPGWTTGPPRSEQSGADPAGGSGWASPGGAGQPWSGWTSGPTPGAGWAGSAPPPSGWRTPDVKPGVVALRPLGAGEIVDGAITTVRQNPKATIGLAAIIGAITALIGLLASWVVSNQEAFADPNPTVEEVGDALAVALPVMLIGVVVSWLATVILTGLLTVVVGQAVIGFRLTIGEAWAKARPRLWRLVGLTLLYTLIWLGSLIGVMVVTTVLAVAIADGGGAAGVIILGFVGAVVLGVWLYVRFALAVPSLMLESQPFGSHTRPVRIGRALGRSAELARGSWWRVFGILLMITIIGGIVRFAISVPFDTIAGIGVTDPDAVMNLSFGSLLLSSVGQVVATAIAAPFVAAATVLLYIDMRIRREGLDLELARAAGVSLPGRGPGSAPPGSYGPGWTAQPGGQHGHPRHPTEPPPGSPPPTP